MLELLQQVDFAFIANFIITIVSGACGILAFYIKRLYSTLDEHERNVRKLEDDLADFKLEIAKNHVTKDDIAILRVDISNMLSNMRGQLISIEDHLRQKKH